MLYLIDRKFEKTNKTLLNIEGGLSERKALTKLRPIQDSSGVRIIIKSSTKKNIKRLGKYTN